MSRKKLWFGTEQRAGWMTVPNSGADSSPVSWGSEGTLLNGGGFGLHAMDSHKEYIYEWPSSSSREDAQELKSYRDGTFGRGLLYWQDPLTYSTNVLPARWADPSMALGSEAPSLVPGVVPSAVTTSSRESWGLPVRSAQYDLTGAGTLNPLEPEGRVFVIIPEGFTLFLGAFYSFTGSGGVWATPLNSGGSLGATTRLTASANNAADPFQNSFSGVRGVYLKVGKSGAGAATVTLSGMMGRISANPAGAQVRGKPWIGGQGHSGCRFKGTPSYISNTGLYGGRIGYAASFIEVGDWLYG